MLRHPALQIRMNANWYGALGETFRDKVGRIGDSAVIGAGTYADDALGAISATGVGEAIIRAVWARDTAEMLRDGGDPAVVAALAVIRLERASGGKGGLIIVDPYGRVLQKTPLFTQELLVEDLRFVTARTIYTRFGDVVAWASLAITLAALLAAARVRYN